VSDTIFNLLRLSYYNNGRGDVLRPRRIEYPGAIYHAMQRGNNKEIIFRGNNDKKFFMAQLANTKKKFGFELYAYALLDNHYHLLLKTGEVPLQKIMQRQNSLYSRFYNRSYDRSGHLFGLRYKAYIIDDDRYLFAVLSYIHWNPINAGLADSLTDYRWSSDYNYRHNRSGLVDIDFIFNSISNNRGQAINEYLRMMKEISVEDIYFKEKVSKDCLEETDRSSFLEKIFSQTCQIPEDQLLIKEGSRKRNLKEFKEKFIHEALERGYTLKEIATFINISINAVHKISEKVKIPMQ
jgi:putative transposase